MLKLTCLNNICINNHLNALFYTKLSAKYVKNYELIELASLWFQYCIDNDSRSHESSFFESNPILNSSQASSIYIHIYYRVGESIISSGST